MRLTRTKDGGVTVRLAQKEAEKLHWAENGPGYDQATRNEFLDKLAVILGSEGRIGGEADART